MFNILKYILDFFRPLLLVIMWPLLIVNPFLTILIQIIYKPVSLLLFTFIASVFLSIILFFGSITNNYTIYHSIIIGFSSSFGNNYDIVKLFNIVSLISSVVAIILLYMLYKKNKFQFFK